MGKKRIVKKGGGELDQGLRSRSLARVPRKRVGTGVLCVQSTYNNTKVLLTDTKGDALASCSSGALGFKGAKKGTPFAAAKVAELVADKAVLMDVKEVQVMVKGVGSGREAAIRAFAAKGIDLIAIRDVTPNPHNGPRPKKARRV